MAVLGISSTARREDEDVFGFMGEFCCTGGEKETDGTGGSNVFVDSVFSFFLWVLGLENEKERAVESSWVLVSCPVLAITVLENSPLRVLLSPDHLDHHPRPARRSP